ncbi:MAG: alpha/beta hydrolase [Spirosomataceae bacterium]
MKILKRILKYITVFLLILILGFAGYVYSLTFTAEGRLDWGQALFAKLSSGQGDIGALKKMNLEQRRQVFSNIPYPEIATIDSLKITSDSLQIYIFKPKDVPTNSPIVVYYHGGGFVFPWTTISEARARKYAIALNKIVVGVDYRVAPENPYPIPNDDCYKTFKWVIDNGLSFGGNPDKIMLIGESAGATLTATVAQRARDEGLTNIKFQVLDCPAVDLPFKYESYKKLNKVYDHGGTQFTLDSYLPKLEDRNNAKAFPLYANLSGLPPAFVITCQFDVLKDQGLAYAEKLKRAKVPTKYLEVKGMLHTIPGPFNEKDRDKVTSLIVEETKKHIE